MRTVTALIVTVATVGAIAAPASAAGFTDYRQAAADQYGAVSGSSAGAPAAHGVAGKHKKHKAVRKHKGSAKKHKATRRHGTAGEHQGGALHRPTAVGGRPGSTTTVLGANDVAVPRHSGHLELGHGSLPFTGGASGTVALIGLMLLAAGFLLAASLRFVRPRRSRSAA
jgi:hypothetical protein